MSVRVTAVDLETGDQSEAVIEPGNYVLIAVPPCFLYHEQHHRAGTTVLTLKGRRADLMGTVDLGPEVKP
jgi:hypothetical protein